ncbi:MAG: tyrosine--tRNA ligase [Chloroflexota bacterium]|nr:tyrosine--tRNA ligase [Chloroflexota bacterium]MDE2940776.1 tyrosine--tRNA ligase [Chloroflexota bacterium]MDE3266958.1 tyrosine--tRNA ligase [Chloroflexota bacterium]
MSGSAMDPRTLHSITKRGVSDIIVEEEFVRLLGEGKPLRLKMGFDPSRPDIHLGHAVGLRKLRQLQELGHQVILIVGDWTAQIGDPSGQSATRQMLTAEEVRANAETYMQQFFKVVDRYRTQTVWQSEWFGKFSLATVIDLTRRFTVAQFLARDDFANRFRAQQPIAITELLYPLLQAYDSVAIESDVEFGGSDQRFNLLVGRDLQAMMGQRQQQCFIMPLLVGTDGVQKMSKSLDNYIGVFEPPNDIYGKAMSIADGLILDYFELLTDVSDEDLAEMRSTLEADAVNPMELKKRLARDLVAQFHDPQTALRAEQHFESTYQRGEAPEEAQVISLTEWVERLREEHGDVQVGDPAAGLPIVPIMVGEGLAASASEAKRLLQQGAVEVDGERLTGQTALLREGSLMRVGRRRFARFVGPTAS